MRTPLSAEPVPAGRTSEEVRRALAERIGSGQLRPGQRLGAERALAAELGVSRATLRRRHLRGRAARPPLRGRLGLALA